MEIDLKKNIILFERDNKQVKLFNTAEATHDPLKNLT